VAILFVVVQSGSNRTVQVYPLLRLQAPEEELRLMTNEDAPAFILDVPLEAGISTFALPPHSNAFRRIFSREELISHLLKAASLAPAVRANVGQLNLHRLHKSYESKVKCEWEKVSFDFNELQELSEKLNQWLHENPGVEMKNFSHTIPENRIP